MGYGYLVADRNATLPTSSNSAYYSLTLKLYWYILLKQATKYVDPYSSI
jgi:hypothetical protein